MISFSKYVFDIKAMFGYIAAPSFALAFAVYGHKWFLVASVLSIIAAIMAQSLKLANSPSPGIVIPPGNNAAPVVNGDGTPVGKVGVSDILHTDRVTPMQ